MRQSRILPRLFAFALLALSLPVPGLAGTVPDSVPPARDPFLAPPPSAVPDTNPAAAPMQEAVRLSTRGAFSAQAPRVGDSLDYVVSVEWEDTQVPVIILAPDSVDFPGFKILGQATQHKKLANGQTVRNHTEYQYHLRAQVQGPGKAIALKLRYLTGMSQREEAIFVPSALVDIAPAPVRLLDMLWFKLLLWAVILGGALVLAYASFKLASRKRAAAEPEREDLRPAVEALKSRLRAAQNSPDASKAILLEMEALAMRYLRDNAAPNAAAHKFEPMLDAYLSKPANQTEAAEWAKLKDLFRHARFAGGYKEPHELQDAFRTFRKCIKMTGDDQHD